MTQTDKTKITMIVCAIMAISLVAAMFLLSSIPKHLPNKSIITTITVPRVKIGQHWQQKPHDNPFDDRGIIVIVDAKQGYVQYKWSEGSSMKFSMEEEWLYRLYDLVKEP